jgi:hypothetical protein
LKEEKKRKKPETVIFDQEKKTLPQGIERAQNPTHKAKKKNENQQTNNSRQPYISFLETSFAPFQQQSTDSCKNSFQLRKISSSDGCSIP